MDGLELENDLRLFVYRHFVSAGRVPTIGETALAFKRTTTEIRRVFNTLAEKHVLVLLPESREIWMAMPFSAIPPAFRVVRGESMWWAN